MRTLVSLDAELLTDEDLVGQVGQLLLALVEAAYVLDPADARLVSARETP